MDGSDLLDDGIDGGQITPSSIILEDPLQFIGSSCSNTTMGSTGFLSSVGLCPPSLAGESKVLNLSIGCDAAEVRVQNLLQQRPVIEAHDNGARVMNERLEQVTPSIGTLNQQATDRPSGKQRRVSSRVRAPSKKGVSVSFAAQDFNEDGLREIPVGKWSGVWLALNSHNHHDDPNLELPRNWAYLTSQALGDLVHKNRPSIVFLMESKNNKVKLETIRCKLGFDGSCYVDPEGLSGGLALW
ncbi:hypothetical protein Vadar_014937 [Vaccinium darrowii]|uniref:Uncharacterized protein n=1 Tax=Vaccinium darrowii TaxID=229202 RepID=A0ACB7Z4N1_9ERIC|nr:hypothetical protein Vadar_014937 [Vaccinium darrowii]